MSIDRQTVFVVVPFRKGIKGHVVAGAPVHAPDEDGARRRAQAATSGGAIGAVAFAGPADLEGGAFQPVILEVCGLVPAGAIERLMG